MKAQLCLVHKLPHLLFKTEKTSIVGFRFPGQSPSASSVTSHFISNEKFQMLLS